MGSRLFFAKRRPTVSGNSPIRHPQVKSLSGTTWKLGNRSKSVVGSIRDVVEQIDRTIKSLPKT